MEYIKDKKGTIVIAFDGDNLHYLTQEPDGDMELNESISIKQLRAENVGGLKLFTILNLQEELGIISDINYVVKKIKKTIPLLAQLIKEYEDSISSLSERIILLEMEGSGPTSGWMDYLFLEESNRTFHLYSSRRDFLSASEKIEYYGLGESEYWDQIQPNGEFIEGEISEIKNGYELHDEIVLLLKMEEQWNMEEDEIDWEAIVEILLNNKGTNNLGIELKSKTSND